MFNPEITGKVLTDNGVKIFFVLDFDGVINTISDVEDFPNDSNIFVPVVNLRHGATAANIFGNMQKMIFHVQFAPDLISELNGIVGRDDVQLIWLTAWKQNALSVMEAIGMKSSRPAIALNYSTDSSDDQVGKPVALRNFLEDIPGDSKIVWIDDTLFGDEFYESIVDRFFDSENILKIGPNQNFGITKSDVTLVSDFIG